MKIFISAILLGHFSINTIAQQEPQKPVHYHGNEIGMANSPVYIVGEKEWVYGLHIHYIKNIKQSKFGVGLGYEQLFDEHQHSTIGVVGSYHLNNNIHFNISPGFTVEQFNYNDPRFALHIEATYEFEIGHFLIGPVAEYAYDIEDTHLSAGLHLGYTF